MSACFAVYSFLVGLQPGKYLVQDVLFLVLQVRDLRPDPILNSSYDRSINSTATTPDDTAQWGDIVLLAVPFRVAEAFPTPATVQGKIVIDATNPYADNFQVMDLSDRTSYSHAHVDLDGIRSYRR